MLDGNTDADGFTVRPTATTPVTVNGQAPTVAPGDVLRVDLTGVSGTALQLQGPGNGTMTFAGHANLSYTSIEDLGVINGQLTPVASTVRLTASQTKLRRGQVTTLTAKAQLAPDNTDNLTGLRVQFRVNGVVVGSAALKLVAGQYQAQLNWTANTTGNLRVTAVFLGRTSSNQTALIAQAASNAVTLAVTGPTGRRLPWAK